MKSTVLILFIFAAAVASCFAQAAMPINPGMQMLETEHYAGAQAYFQSILQKDPRNTEAVADMAKLCLARGQNKMGVRWAQKAVAFAPNDAAYELLLGDAYGHYVNDVGIFSKFSIARKIRGAYQKAVQLNPGNFKARYRLATYYLEAPGIAGGSTAKADEQIQILDKNDPIEADWLRAKAAMQHKDNKKAWAYLRSAAKLDKTAESEVRLGGFLERQKRYARALTVFEDSVRKDPTYSESYYRIGLSALLGKIHIQEGIRAMQKYLTMPHDWESGSPYTWAHYRLGMLYGVASEKTNEKVQYEAALKLDPGFKQAREALAAM